MTTGFDDDEPDLDPCGFPGPATPFNPTASSTNQPDPQPHPECPFPHEAAHRPACPFCGSRRVQTRDLARRLCAALGALAGALGGAASTFTGAMTGALTGAELGAELGALAGTLSGGPPGAALGLVSGAVIGALVAAAAGCAAGAELGSSIDRRVLQNVRCLDCDHVFSLPDPAADSLS